MAYRANKVQIYVPANMPFTARNIYDFHRLQNKRDPNAVAMRRRLGVALGLGDGATANRIRNHNQFGNYYGRYLTLRNAGGLKHRNLQGGNRWPTGRRYTHFSDPVVKAKTHRTWTIPRALQAYVPQLSRRAAQLVVSLSQPATNFSRPGLPVPVARKVASLVRRLEIMNVRNNPFSAPVPRHFTNRRALPAASTPANNNNGPRPRRSARRSARRNA